MASMRVHREWEDWLGIGTGVLIGVSPWIAGQADDKAVIVNAAAVGFLVLVLAELELVKLRRWEEVGEMACGLWLIASPFVFGYTGALRYWHFALGAFVVLLAMLEIWQKPRRFTQEER